MTIDMQGSALVGGFDSELAVKWIGPKTCQLTAPLIWTGTQIDPATGELETFVVPAGFVTDLATSPRFLHWLVLPYGPYTRAAVLHDYLLHLLAQWTQADPETRGPCPITSRDADGIFRRAMEDLGTPPPKRRIMWAAVRAAACFSRNRAYGRDFHKDAPRVLGIGLLVLLSVLIPLAAVFVLLALGLVRLVNWIVPDDDRVRKRSTRKSRRRRTSAVDTEDTTSADRRSEKEVRP